MDRLFLSHPNEDADVDALLSQLNDEHLMTLKINSHTSTQSIGYPTACTGNGVWSHTGSDDADGAIDSQLSSRLAKLKAGHRLSSSSAAVAASKSKGKDTEAKKENGGLSFRRSSSKREDGVIAAGASDKRRLSRSQSQNSEFLSCRSGVDNLHDSEDIDANLVARFRALKGASSPKSSDASLVQFSGNLSSQGGSSDYYNSSSFGSSSPSATLLGRSSSRSSPRVMSTSVASSCYCSTPSPFKLLKQLSSKKLPSAKPATLPISPSSKSPSTKGQFTGNGHGHGHGKSAGKESSSKKTLQKSRGDDVENLSTVKDVKRLLSSVADRVGVERSRVSSAEEEDSLSGDLRAFSLLDREQEYMKASSEEEKLNREAERVVEWAKDAARLGLDASDGEDEDLELGEEDLDSESSTEKHIKNAKDSKKASKPKRKKMWGLF
ncbi:hypothetical protein MPTK1_2g18800 [Marchantia polymorpha subsp. ruderalis]|uniref:Uncharacterized protein n=1 Tax=Marchantia polymorpha TaxID=3197 RepID=A0A2R6W6Z2_MARPO|nr:hypothetical protein MARPO_0137s0003 [Marchantia polymorpha]BBN02869.1 hypothetical protein Mp_2g18800 [Marchantia polymorpha subsp. ruderalis]|eukprot:PTQ29628.1 hypothetical protein MARPO_0137s0003 [Marchantia polymorpha]